MKTTNQILLLILLLWQIGFTTAANIDCKTTENDIEIMICSSQHLTNLHDELVPLVEPHQAFSVFNQLVYSKWLKARDNCYDSVCLSKLYRNLIDALKPNKDSLNIINNKSNTVYDFETNNPWQRFSLTRIYDDAAFVLSAKILDDVLYVIIYSLDNNNNPIFYEYTTNQNILYRIKTTGNIKNDNIYSGIFDGTISINTGIEGDTFYFQQETTNNKNQSMAYKLGSREPAQPTTHNYASTPRIEVNAKANFLIEEKDSAQIIMEYTDPNNPKKTYRDIAAQNKTLDEIGRWQIAGKIWHPIKPIMYFDNSSDLACIWRIDLVNKQLSKIVPEHDTTAPYPIDLGINNLEAILYTQHNYQRGYTQLMLALSIKE